MDERATTSGANKHPVAAVQPITGGIAPTIAPAVTDISNIMVDETMNWRARTDLRVPWSYLLQWSVYVCVEDEVRQPKGSRQRIRPGAQHG